MEQQTGQPELNALGKVVAQLSEYGHNASNNFNDALSNMTLQSWIRLTVIIGGYMLLRPYVLKLSTKVAVRKLEEEDAKSKGEEKAKPVLTPNEFRGIKEKLYEADDGEAGSSGADWGNNARLKQRQMLKDLLEEEQRRRAADNEDADIQEFLED